MDQAGVTFFVWGFVFENKILYTLEILELQYIYISLIYLHMITHYTMYTLSLILAFVPKSKPNLSNTNNHFEFPTNYTKDVSICYKY